MAKQIEQPDETQALLHEPAMSKIAGGDSSHFIKMLRALAHQALEANANHAYVRFQFVTDDETIDAVFVPEITITVRTPREQGV